MGVRFRRSIRIAPGVRLNVTKTGVGVTAGSGVARYSVHSSGRRTVGLGLPGTGAYYQKSASRTAGTGRSGTTGRDAEAPAPIDQVRVIPKPGFLASGPERAYYEGLVAYLRGDHETALTKFEQVLASDPSSPSAHLFAGTSANTLGDATRATAHLEAVVGSSHGMPDRYQAKFVPDSVFSLTLAVRITDSVTATPPFGGLAAVLALAEVYQAAGRLEDAIGLMQQVYEGLPDPLVRLSLCDLLYADGDADAVIETSAGVTNGSDVDVETMHLRGAALVAKGLASGAVDTFTAALAKSANRDAGLLNAIRYDRALVYEQLGQPKRARADLERLYATDPGFEDVKERLATTP